MVNRHQFTMDVLVPKSAVKISPIHLLNFYPTVEVSYEHRILPSFTLQEEVGYVLNYGSDERGDFQNKRGVKLKLEGRYYFFGRTDKKKMYYVSGEVYGNFVNFDRSGRGPECFDIECQHAFIRDYTYVMKYREHGFSIKLGWFKYFGRVFFDLNSGWTIRSIKYREPSGIQNFQEDWEFFQIPNEDDRIALSPNFGARMGYRFR